MSATRSAAETVNNWCHRHGYDPMDVYEVHSLLAALAEGGYVIVDRELYSRLRTAARIAVRYVLGDDVDLSQEIAVDDLYLLPGDLDPLPTQEGDYAGYVVVERERWERVRDAAEEMEKRIAERGWGDQYTRPGDLDPLPTQEGT